MSAKSPEVGEFFLMADKTRVVEIMALIPDDPLDITPQLTVRDVATQFYWDEWANGLEREATEMEVLGAASGGFDGG